MLTDLDQGSPKQTVICEQNKQVTISLMDPSRPLGHQQAIAITLKRQNRSMSTNALERKQSNRTSIQIVIVKSHDAYAQNSFKN